LKGLLFKPTRPLGHLQLVTDFYRRYPEEMPQWPSRLEEQTLQRTKPRSFPERQPAEPRR